MTDGASALNELVQKCKKGDERAWHVLFDQLAPVILNLCKRNKLTREQSLDVLGQVSLQLVSSINKLKHSAAIFSYVRIITKRQIFDFFRKSRQEQKYLDDIDPLLAASEDNNPDSNFEQRQRGITLRDALLSLPSKDYQLLHALFLDKGNPSYEEIGKRLQMPVSSIGPSRARSLEKLYKVLKGKRFRF